MVFKYDDDDLDVHCDFWKVLVFARLSLKAKWTIQHR